MNLQKFTEGVIRDGYAFINMATGEPCREVIHTSSELSYERTDDLSVVRRYVHDFLILYGYQMSLVNYAMEGTVDGDVINLKLVECCY